MTRLLLRSAVLVPLACASCAAPVGSSQGPLQPQAVSGPCQVKKFFLLGTTTVHTEMVVGNTGQACTFTMLDAAYQLFPAAALVTSQPAHGRATAAVVSSGLQVAVAYTPRPGYAGPDQFTVTIEPNDHAVAVAVTVQPTPPAPGSRAP